jgi:hypothetical protein
MDDFTDYSYLVSGRQLIELRLAIKNLIFEYTVLTQRHNITNGFFCDEIERLNKLEKEIDFGELEMVKNK